MLKCMQFLMPVACYLAGSLLFIDNQYERPPANASRACCVRARWHKNMLSQKFSTQYIYDNPAFDASKIVVFRLKNVFLDVIRVLG